MKTLLSFIITFVICVGCATKPGEQSQTCDTAITAYEVYRAILEVGDREPSEGEIIAAAGAAVYLRLNCGWEPLITRSRGPVVDDYGIQYIAPPNEVRVE